ncbi:ABC transporter permease [Staphylococcus sp. SQ8-PEA]|uniref:Putative hemin transport system permease protein HrtB n=1 Tax=Staphylococcus marylandisciuri TaxID=2981529 RepID=A0ABT2QMR7_9STAP|nr:ABC transporter permease [Staphylococcus marylandisciuri]MCU5745257.1 ABC transporter permease [Staphylococcus marylandisciuri]
MSLAWKEMKYYKFRFILIMMIILLLGLMVLFISGLAKGLGRENISLLDNMNASNYVMQEKKQPQLQTSILNHHQSDQIEEVVNQRPLKLASDKIYTNKDEESIILTNTVKNDKPKLKEGRYPKEDKEVAINEKLTSQGISVGDTIKLKGNHKVKVSGILNDTMYSHSSVVMMSDNGFNKQVSKAAKVYPIKNLSEKQKNKLNAIDGVKVYSQDDITQEIPSYQAEQAPLNMMIVSLFVITAIVLSAFFYVMTIQKISQIGILKAIGIKTKHLLLSLVTQILITTLAGVLLAIIIVSGLSIFMPVSMPFHLELTNIGLVIVIFIIVGIVGAILSFIKLFRIDPIEAIGGAEE